MPSKRACLAGFRSGRRISVSAPGSVRTYGPRLSAVLPIAAAVLAATCLLTGAANAAAPAQDDTDTAIWRAEHGLLLGVARAGDRLVAVGNAGHILLSDDNGATWRIAKSPTDELLTSVVFPTPQEGWAVGQDEVILHSTDGGASWTQQHIKADADQVLFSIISLSPGHLFTSGSYNLTEETTDGGATWTEGKLANLDDDYHLNCDINRGDDILITGEAGHAFIRYAGAWTPMKLPYDGSQFACALGPDGSFYSFGLRGTAFKSLPGARDWTKLETGTQRSIFGATSLTTGHIAVVGSNGLVELLDPATGKMTTLPRPTAATISGVTEAKDGKLVTVGDDGVHLVDPAMTAEVSQ